MKVMNKLTLTFLSIIALFGTYAGLELSLDHLKVGEICPMLGSVPACIIVFFGYLFVLISAFAYKKNWAAKLFYIGWTPVFLLALSGVFLELTRGGICPPGPAGIPKCFFSLAMATLALILFILLRRSRTST